MFVIAHHDEASDRTRYVRDDSRGETLWSTSDPGRAMPFDSFEDAEAWAFSVTQPMTDRLLSRRAYVLDLESGERRYLRDPEIPAWIDDHSATSPAPAPGEFDVRISEAVAPPKTVNRGRDDGSALGFDKGDAA